MTSRTLRTRALPRPRRKIADWLQVALLAMLLQVLTPVLALHGMAAAAAERDGGQALCTVTVDGIVHHAAHTQVDRHGDHKAAPCQACPFCSAAHFALPASLPVPPCPQLQGYVVRLDDLTAQPRGPPLFRPKARAPPAFS